MIRVRDVSRPSGVRTERRRCLRLRGSKDCSPHERPSAWPGIDAHLPAGTVKPVMLTLKEIAEHWRMPRGQHDPA
jgi:hypothetical protein